MSTRRRPSSSKPTGYCGRCTRGPFVLRPNGQCYPHRCYPSLGDAARNSDAPSAPSAPVHHEEPYWITGRLIRWNTAERVSLLAFIALLLAPLLLAL